MYYSTSFLTVAFDSDILFISIPIIFLIISFIIWLIWGRDPKQNIQPNPYSPTLFGSQEYAFLLRQEVSNQDMIATLLDLANKGYIKIKANHKDQSSPNLVIIKVRQYDDNIESENHLMKHLFSIDEPTTPDQLMYIGSNAMNQNAAFFQSAQRQLFCPNLKFKRAIVVAMLLITSFLMIGKPVLTNCDLTIATMVFCIHFFCIFLLVADTKKLLTKIVILVAVLEFCKFIYPPFVLPAITSRSIYGITFMVGLLCLAGMLAFYYFMPKISPVRHESLIKLKGLQQFMNNPDKNLLITLQNENRDYFYQTLPTAYILRCAGNWYNHFQTLRVSAPAWYESDTPFDYSTFATEMTVLNHAFSDIQ